ncbi:unnamed protein product [Brachionus calyciflorus]|uniref:ubiquitinyl hydrolase 1 n=1 Tax=Brachionus calyciflorus TaxID=104777 RepID=A0A813SGA8_9BILA|nr:unnamed protein product [Brachionus calyciflorus]
MSSKTTTNGSVLCIVTTNSDARTTNLNRNKSILKNTDNSTNNFLHNSQELSFGDFTKEELSYLNSTNKVNIFLRQKHNNNRIQSSTKNHSKIKSNQERLLKNKKTSSNDKNSIASNIVDKFDTKTHPLLNNNNNQKNEIDHLGINKFDIEFGFNLKSSDEHSLLKNNNNNNKMDTNGTDLTNLPVNSNTDTQRRNKKRKPPNYYQNEEIAAILKNADAIITPPSSTQTVDLPTSNSSSSSSPQTTPTEIKPIETKPIESKVETVTNSLEEVKITENDNSVNKKENKEQVNSVPSDQSSNKSWSSLFKLRQESAAAAAVAAAAVVAPPVQKPSLKPQPSQATLKTVAVAPTPQSVPQSQPTHSQSSLSSSSDSNLSPDSLKTIGNFLKNCELKHSAPALQPRGIRNRQNWCYINATLQALLACPPFYNLIKNIYNKIKGSNVSLQTVPFISALGRFINEFKIMVRSSNSSDQIKLSASNGKELILGESFEIDYFYEALSSVKSEITFKSGRQEDAQEFLSLLLNRLHEEMIRCLESLNQTENGDNTHLNGNKSNEINNNTNNLEENEADEWKEVGKKNRAMITRKAEFKQSPLSDIFCGQFRSALSQSGAKDKESASLEPFFTLPLDIQSDSIRNINQALEHFVQREEVHGLTHQETKQEIEAYKRVSFEDLPPVLILYLKCFVYDKHGGIQKLLKRLDFQIDLEINKELISSGQRSKLKDKRNKYKLFAVEYHYGDKATGGHYITDVYHPGIISWVRYDDANVKICNNYQVLKSDDKKLVPYLLYYRRADLI